MQVKLTMHNTNPPTITGFIELDAARDVLIEASEQNYAAYFTAIRSSGGCESKLGNGLELTDEALDRLEDVECYGERNENTYAVYVSNLATVLELPPNDEATGNFYGVYDTPADFAEDHAEASCPEALEALPSDIRLAIDWSKVAAGMPAQGFTIIEANGQHYCWTE